MAIANEKSGCLSIIFPFLKRSQKETTSKVLPYRLRDDFLSPAEFSFYKVLSSLVGARLTIQSKVRLADVFFVARPNENVGFFNRIAQKHLDFLVCNSSTMKPLFGIELDDSSHKRDDRQERDEFVENVCQVAGFPLLRLSQSTGIQGSKPCGKSDCLNSAYRAINAKICQPTLRKPYSLCCGCQFSGSTIQEKLRLKLRRC